MLTVQKRKAERQGKGVGDKEGSVGKRELQGKKTSGSGGSRNVSEAAS